MTKTRNLSDLLNASGQVPPVKVSDQSNSSTGAFDLPAGTTAQRPASPNSGYARFNTDEGRAEYWTGSVWVPFNYGGKPSAVNYLVVAGGGGSGTGGGGGGGVLTGILGVTAGSALTVTVGAGGVKSDTLPTSGSNSVFSSVTATGGGYGGTGSLTGASGGSGGGGAGGWSPPATSGGSGTSGQGYAGGNGLGSSGSYANGGGGGGAGSIGQTSTSSQAGNGGIGVSNALSGSATYYAGGGGGGSYNHTAGTGGSGGGGAGYAGQSGSGTNGTANSGGGGGGAYNAGANGGSGVVIISYPDSYSAAASTTGSPTVTTVNGNRIYTFTSSGSITF